MLINMKVSALCALSALAMSQAVPAMAQDAMSKGSMSSGSMMKMSAADTKKMNKCQAMSQDMMMKNAGCMKMMKMHGDMMKGDGMMKSDSMMSGH